jgi:hypothetical protein
MLLRVVILVFAATSCTARLIGKALHTWTLVHSVGNRSATDADVKQAVTSWLQTLDADLFCTLVMWWDKCLNANGDYVAVWPVPFATQYHVGLYI